MQITKRHIIFFIHGLILSVGSLKAAGEAGYAEKIVHEIQVSHPGNKDQEYSQFHLIEYQQKDGIPMRYTMDVVSVYCDAEVCKVDTVRMIWNNFGKYTSYSLPPSIQLEKAEGIPFTKEEYQSLDKILKDTDSPFKNLKTTDIVSSDQAHIGGVDAYSGATVLEFDDDVSVQGAALTCFTLWHWANGEVVDLIRNLTGDRLTAKQLRSYWLSSNEEKQFFALEQFMRREAFDDETLALIKETINSRNQLQQKLLVSYLEHAKADTYFQSILEFFHNASSAQRVNYLISLLKSEHTANEGYYDKFCIYLPQLRSYQEVNLMLTLMEQKNRDSQRVNDAASELLSQAILKSRRAYWFLSNRNLNKEQQKKVKRFYKKNRKYL